MTANTYKSQSMGNIFNLPRLTRGMAFGVIIITALLAFEIFNYSTTDFALTDLLGDLAFMGVRWATILSIAFCGIDFAGIARLFSPDPRKAVHNETWYLFGAWLLAATMNAILTWWGVSLAILNHQTLGNTVLDRETLIRVVPIFIAILVWLIRVLIIGTFSVAGDNLFDLPEDTHRHQRAKQRPSAPTTSSRSSLGTTSRSRNPTPRPVSASARTSTSNPAASQNEPEYVQAELSYHPAHMQTREIQAIQKSGPANHLPSL